MKIILLTAMLCGLVSSTNAANVRTYRVVESIEHFVSFYPPGEGILFLSTDIVSARLRGTFDVKIEEDGDISLSRFDLSFFELSDSNHDLEIPSEGFVEGQFNHAASELIGELSGSAGQEILSFDNTELSAVDPPSSLRLPLYTSFEVQHLTNRMATLNFSSGKINSVIIEPFCPVGFACDDVSNNSSAEDIGPGSNRLIEVRSPIISAGSRPGLLRPDGNGGFEVVPGAQLIVEIVPEPSATTLLCWGIAASLGFVRVRHL